VVDSIAKSHCFVYFIHIASIPNFYQLSTMRFSITTALAFSLAGSSLASAGISPASVSENADPGSSFSIDKVITTAEIPPNPDVVLLVDDTGSMGPAIASIKTNLDSVITAVTNAQPTAQFAVTSFGDLAFPNPFTVNQPLTSSVAALTAAVGSLTASGGGDIPEDWINALYEISTGAITFRADSSRIIVLVSDAPSHDPSGGHTLANAIAALTAQSIRVIGVNVQDLDATGQATAVTAATGGVIIGTTADAVTTAIISGLKNLDVLVKPDVVSCDSGLTVLFNPTTAQVTSGTTVTFHEVVMVAADATQDATLHCTVSFLMNGTPGGDAFIQSISVTVNQLGCFLCVPQPGQDVCHPTTSCSPTPFGAMCLTRPGYKADGVADSDVKMQWRMKWPVPGQEHRVAVKPGTSADTLCDPQNTGPDVCKEVVIANCSTTTLDDARYGTDQKVMGEGEL
jgi:von Willebrand factor type A domain